MIDKEFCMSSYLVYRYIEDEDINFFPGLEHHNLKLYPNTDKVLISNAKDIHFALESTINKLKNKKLGIMLSGGMDSAIIASYMQGCDAYTYRFLNGSFMPDETRRAEYYADKYGLKLHYVDIDYDVIDSCLDKIMESKCAPVHSIEPQIYTAAIQAKNDDVECMLIGNSSDPIFGGMDQLLSKNWLYTDFIERYTFLKPELVLNSFKDVNYLFERYKVGNNIDFLSFMDNVFLVESSSSYFNAFKVADLEYCDPYLNLSLKNPLDLSRIRNGESKYFIRELMAMRYPEIKVPEKIPMPRPVDIYFQDWVGPKRKEFKKNLHINKFSGNQKWQMYCLERFLNLFD